MWGVFTIARQLRGIGPTGSRDDFDINFQESPRPNDHYKRQPEPRADACVLAVQRLSSDALGQSYFCVSELADGSFWISRVG
jgi:hypothetical protein